MPRSTADWIRSFAAQGMTRDEIAELTAASRPQLNNALNRVNVEHWFKRFNLGDLPKCRTCGAVSFEQEPSRIGRGRHCDECGAHYDYWASRRVEPKQRIAKRKERCVRCARWFRAANGGLSCPKCVDDFRAAARRAELFATVEKKRAEDAMRAEQKRHEQELAAEVDAGIAELLAELEARAERAAVIAEIRAEFTQPANDVPKKKHKAKAQQRIERQRALIEPTLRARFEQHGGRMSKQLMQRKLQDEADEFLRKHEANMLANPPPEPPPFGLQRTGDFGMWRKDHGDKTDWRGDIRRAAAAGDESAMLRAWALFDNTTQEDVVTD